MKESNLEMARKDVEDALKTVEEMEKYISSDSSKSKIKEKFISLSDKVQKLETILKNEGIL
ncbi:hypothetical protein [Clostridium sp. BJN0001]|uniref:hypothetical protein n=1 Tax=Clostridium sp. BJN0001 TaxID=2930219 RepID=UPI001FD22B13|nr:hypothetical protein [Clostridium sp. BJN0001]